MGFSTSNQRRTRCRGRMVVTMDVGLKKKLNGPSNIKYGFLNWENIGNYRNM
jgi:hypothetical protein